MKKILWLPSWYPSRMDQFTGDFIRRHAKAAALYHPIAVIYIVKDEKGQYTKNILEEHFVQEGLHETIVYYNPVKTGIGLIDKFFSSAKYLSVYKKYIRKFIVQHGKPAFIHVHVPVRAGILARWCKKNYHIPFIVTEHWCAYNTLNPHHFFTRSLLFRRLTKKIFEAADRVTAVCEANRQELLQLFTIKKSMVIHNVADTRLFYFQGKEPALAFVFVHVSSLSSQKNVEGILSAFAILKKRFQNWRCVIVGPHTPALMAHAVQLGLEAFIDWTGEQPYESVALHTRKANCMVMFSRYENSPCTIIEALCAGIPVIASNVGGIPEIIDNTNGLLVDSEDIIHLAVAMQQMIMEYHLYQRRAIAEKASATFSYEAVGAKMASLYTAGTNL